MIRFLKDCECGVKVYWECGDKCCSGYEDDGTAPFKAGEEVEEYTVNLYAYGTDLEEGVDYEIVD